MAKNKKLSFKRESSTHLIGVAVKHNLLDIVRGTVSLEEGDCIIMNGKIGQDTKAFSALYAGFTNEGESLTTMLQDGRLIELGHLSDQPLQILRGVDDKSGKKRHHLGEMADWLRTDTETGLRFDNKGHEASILNGHYVEIVPELLKIQDINKKYLDYKKSFWGRIGLPTPTLTSFKKEVTEIVKGINANCTAMVNEPKVS